MWPSHTLLWGYEAPTDNPFDVEALKLANPATWITKDYLKRQGLDPELTDAQVLQLHGCVWASSEATWVSPDAWMDSLDRTRQLQDGEKIVLGFDGSYKRDATALIACTLDGFISPIAIWERPEGADPDWKIPRIDVDDTIQIAMEKYKVVELAADPPGWASEIERWQEMYGDVVLSFPTNDRKRMAAACDRFRAGTLEKTLTHSGNHVLTRHIGFAQAKETPFGIVITKDHVDSPRKIDAAVAAVIAYDRACWHEANKHKPSVPMVAWV
jgi:phage terminase large subunit-like protein